MQNFLINIMLPVYNGVPLLKASIESIRCQTYPAWQCIVCDDGSTDGTGEYLQTLTHDSRFILLRNERNMGRGYTRQRILEACTAPYICMLDSGDLMHPERLKRQVEYLEVHPEVSLCSTAMLSFGTHTNALAYRASGREADTILTFDGEHTCCFAPCMFRNPQYGVSFQTDLRFCEDQHFLRHYLHSAPQYYCMSEPLYYYSEFDSCTRAKTRRAYFQDMLTYFHEHLYRQSLRCLLKFIYSLLVFPFLTDEQMVQRRAGRPATEQERAEFNNYGRTLL